jgi:protein-L-isoaspartate(D-aspartate) O-methyltransferase
MDRLASHRKFFAELITAAAGLGDKHPRLEAALASTSREAFLGPGPWKVFAGAGLIETPTNDPAFLYQDVVVSISPERRINNGQPVLHALSLGALNIQQGEAILHIGAGTGYYTALLAQLTGPTGKVDAYELETDLAEAAARNLSNFPLVTVQARSGSEPPLPSADAIYVNAGATSPLDVWLDALRVGGRLLFPLTPGDGPGGTPGIGAMLLITRSSEDRFAARFLCQAAFIPCAGARDPQTAAQLSIAFRRGDFRNVRSLHRNSVPDDTCWCSGPNWWLTTAES